MPSDIEQALELLRKAYNHMGRADYHMEVYRLCKDNGNLRYPLMDAGQTATITHHEATGKSAEERDHD